MSAMAIAEAAPGRFALAIGAGSPAIVDRWNGIPFDLPYSKVRDMTTVLKRAFGGEKVSESLETMRVDGAKLSRQLAPAPLLHIAALRERMLKLAGAEADGVII